MRLAAITLQSREKESKGVAGERIAVRKDFCAVSRPSFACACTVGGKQGAHCRVLCALSRFAGNAFLYAKRAACSLHVRSRRRLRLLECVSRTVQCTASVRAAFYRPFDQERYVGAVVSEPSRVLGDDYCHVLACLVSLGWMRAACGRCIHGRRTRDRRRSFPQRCCGGRCRWHCLRPWRAAVAARIGARRGQAARSAGGKNLERKKMDSGKKSCAKNSIFCSMFESLFAWYDGMRNTTRYVSR